MCPKSNKDNKNVKNNKTTHDFMLNDINSQCLC